MCILSLWSLGNIISWLWPYACWKRIVWVCNSRLVSVCFVANREEPEKPVAQSKGGRESRESLFLHFSPLSGSEQSHHCTKTDSVMRRLPFSFLWSIISVQTHNARDFSFKLISLISKIFFNSVASLRLCLYCWLCFITVTFSDDFRTVCLTGV